MPTSVKRGTSGKIAWAVVVVVTMLVLLAGLSAVFLPKDNRESSGMYEDRANGILGEPSDSIDVLFLGDSEAYSAYSPLQMWGEQGFTSYVCASHAQPLYYGNTLLHRATRDQHPKVVVIETNAIFRRFSVSSALLRTMEDVLPVFEYHDRWKELTPNDFVPVYERTYTDQTKGYVVRWRIEAVGEGEDEDDATPKTSSIPRMNELYLRAMIDYCRSIGAEPVLISTPSTVNWNDRRHDAIQAFADEVGVSYFDLNSGENAVDIDWSTDTVDRGDHLNVSGARKVSSYVAALLADSFDLPDHRGDEAYAHWDKSLEWYEGEVG